MRTAVCSVTLLDIINPSAAAANVRVQQPPAVIMQRWPAVIMQRWPAAWETACWVEGAVYQDNFYKTIQPPTLDLPIPAQTSLYHPYLISVHVHTLRIKSIVKSI